MYICKVEVHRSINSLWAHVPQRLLLKFGVLSICGWETRIYRGYLKSAINIVFFTIQEHLTEKNTLF